MNKKISLGCDRAAHEGAYVRVRAGGPRVGIEVAGPREPTNVLFLTHLPGRGRGRGWDCAREGGWDCIKATMQTAIGLSLPSLLWKVLQCPGCVLYLPCSCLAA